MSPRDAEFLERVEKLARAKKTHASFPQLKYPSLRDEGWHDPDTWLRGKAMDDGADGLWRIHDSLYDLTNFTKHHPGGEDWITLTKGTDITEAFEVHHFTKKPHELLKKYYVGKTTSSRNSPFTFKEDGFYMTLKAKVVEELKNIPKTVYPGSALLTDSLLVIMFIAAPLACLVQSTTSFLLALIVAGLCMNWLAICAHNYIHMKDNWRMYYFSFGLMTFRDFRITHALSHHLYPNTLIDYEISGFEPIFQWLPRADKPMWAKFIFVVQPIIFPIANPWVIMRKVILALTRKGYFQRYWKLSDLVGFTLPLWMWLVTGCNVVQVLRTWVFVVMMSSFFFHMIGLNAAHHHPEIFHDGDEVASETIDWGVHQLAAVMDRKDINGNLFLVMTNFGDHALHHLFPTLDHAQLNHLYPMFLKHCEEHRTKFQVSTQFDLFLGQIRQLLRTKSVTIKNKQK